MFVPAAISFSRAYLHPFLLAAKASSSSWSFRAALYTLSSWNFFNYSIFGLEDSTKDNGIALESSSTFSFPLRLFGIGSLLISSFFRSKNVVLKPQKGIFCVFLWWRMGLIVIWRQEGKIHFLFIFRIIKNDWIWFRLLLFPFISLIHPFTRCAPIKNLNLKFFISSSLSNRETKCLLICLLIQSVVIPSPID